MRQLRLLVVAANVDATDVGEANCAYQWVHHLAKIAHVTLLTQQRAGRQDVASQLPGIEVITFPEFALPARFERITAMLKPGYPVFSARVKAWVKQAIKSGRKFDVAHHLTPVALRYATPLTGFGIPYVLGPHAGSLDTPESFKGECASAPLFTKLRKLDQWRIDHDPWLRKSFAQASCVLGVAPYVARILQSIPLQKFEVMSELGIETLAATHAFNHKKPLRLLHVGRCVRTKGLRDCVRAIAKLKGHIDITLDQAGQGEELEICRKLAVDLGVSEHIRFHGQLPRNEIEKLYANSDIFLFPSFREPSGSVIFEALRHGLCIVTADRGGPGHVIDQTCGVKVAPDHPEIFATGLAEALQELHHDRAKLKRLSQGARNRVASLGLWPRKLEQMLEIYHAAMDRQHGQREAA